jgi:hypothetical protein
MQIVVRTRYQRADILRVRGLKGEARRIYIAILGTDVP